MFKKSASIILTLMCLIILIGLSGLIKDKVGEIDLQPHKFGILPVEVIENNEAIFKIKADLLSLKRGEVYDLYIYNFGGSVAEGMSFISILKETKGKVVMHITSIAASMAANIASTASDLYVDKDSIVIIHVPFVERPDGTKDFRRGSPIMEKYRLITFNLYRDILTEEEKIKVFINNEDLMLTGPDFAARMCNVRKVGCHKPV